ncbi:MAG: HlyD family efflux transporter periplasmic adaptor subunit [Lachnospiraceae bacterium]
MPKKVPDRAESGKGRKKLNIFIIICAIILIYLIIYFCSYFFGNRVELYEVVSGSSQGHFGNQYTALALREETVVNAVDTGYINFFVGDAIPIRVGEQTYVIDESGELSGRLEEAPRNRTVLNENDLKQIKSIILDFDTAFDPANYYDAYYFKHQLKSHILDLINSNAFDTLSNSVSLSQKDTYTIFKSDISGIMQHNIDGFEDYTVDDVEAAAFRRSNYNKRIIASNDLVSEGSAVYKVITSEDWQLIIRLEEDDDFSDVDFVEIEFLSDGIVTEASFETFTRAGYRYGVISLNKYLIRYISDRFVQIRIVNDSLVGLKIPKTAVAQEQFFVVPSEFLTVGGNTSDYGFMKQIIASDGSASVQFVTPQIVKKNDEYCFVSTKDFEQGDILIQENTNAQYKINSKENLQGAYVSSGGLYTFKLIEVIGESSGHYIIDVNTSHGLRIYDQILKDVTKND